MSAPELLSAPVSSDEKTSEGTKRCFVEFLDAFEVELLFTSSGIALNHLLVSSLSKIFLQHNSRFSRPCFLSVVVLAVCA